MTRLISAGCCIAAIVTATMVHADHVVLTNGDTLRGSVIEEREDAVILGHAVLGRVLIPREQISSTVRDDNDGGYALAQAAQDKATAAAAPQPAQASTPVDTQLGSPPTPTAAAETAVLAPPPKPGLFGTNFLAGWNRSLEFGVTGSEGNTQEFALRAAAGADYEDDRDRWKIGAVYYRSESDGEVDRNEFTADLLKDWLIPNEKYFFFATAKYEYDQFQAWESRVSAFGGPGYQFYKDDKWDLLGRAGVGGNYAFDAQNEFTLEALLGLEFNYRFSKTHKIGAFTTFYPSLDPFFQEFRNVSGVAYEVVIDQSRDLSFKMGIENEYESEVESGEKHNDVKYFATLVWGF